MSETTIEAGASCPEWSILNLQYYWCQLNDLFGNHPALGFAITIAVSVTGWLLNSFRVFVVDSRRRLSGKWLLCIKDANGKPNKFDVYRIRQRKLSVSGSIRRLRSLEDSEQEKHKYELQGYAEGDQFVYVFWPTTERVQSFGTCTLIRESDNYYTGVYTRPYLASTSSTKSRTADIVLTRSKGKVSSLMSELKVDRKKKIWKAVYGWRSKLPIQGTVVESTTAADSQETSKAKNAIAGSLQDPD